MEIINYGEAEKPQSEATPGEEEEHEGDQLDVTPPSESPGVKVPSAKSQVGLMYSWIFISPPIIHRGIHPQFRA